MTSDLTQKNVLNTPGLSLPHCIVIIPAHNESRDIAFVIGEIQKHSCFPVVVVDDASSDDTIQRARQGSLPATNRSLPATRRNRRPLDGLAR